MGSVWWSFTPLAFSENRIQLFYEMLCVCGRVKAALLRQRRYLSTAFSKILLLLKHVWKKIKNIIFSLTRSLYSLHSSRTANVLHLIEGNIQCFFCLLNIVQFNPRYNYYPITRFIHTMNGYLCARSPLWVWYRSFQVAQTIYVRFWVQKQNFLAGAAIELDMPAYYAGT